MVVAGGDYVNFVVEYGGKIEKCRVTETALLEQRAYEQEERRLTQLSQLENHADRSRLQQIET
jgi:hypothetical protein